MKRQIRIGYSKKKHGLIDFHAKVNFGEWVDNIEFKQPDHNEDEDIEQAWKRECHKLNEKHPHLHHFVGHRYV